MKFLAANFQKVFFLDKENGEEKKEAVSLKRIMFLWGEKKEEWKELNKHNGGLGFRSHEFGRDNENVDVYNCSRYYNQSWAQVCF